MVNFGVKYREAAELVQVPYTVLRMCLLYNMISSVLGRGAA